MATVYLARDLRHDRPVALKMLHPELAQVLGLERFIREIRIAAYHRARPGLRNAMDAINLPRWLLATRRDVA